MLSLGESFNWKNIFKKIGIYFEIRVPNQVKLSQPIYFD